MKTKTLITLILVAISFPFSINAQKAFQAKMMNRRLGSKTIYQVRSDGDKYRYDFIEGGQTIIVIVNPAQGKTAILMPQAKNVHFTQTSSRMSRSNDPVQAVMAAKNNFEEKKIGTEEITGYTCTKSEFYYADQKIYTVWFSNKLNFPLRIENNLSPQEYMELNAIVEQEIDPSIFIIPEDYTEVDDRMRPIIPEPPAPETWNTIEVDVPFNKEYARGDIIRFTVSETQNYVVILTNSTADPAKIIRKTFRDGKELSDDEQGPLKYRTRRLFGNESFRNIYSWKAGDTKILEVHEGKLNVKIAVENE